MNHRRKYRLLIIAAILLAGLVYFRNAYSFLSPDRSFTSADILVVEGWLPESALDEAAGEFHNGTYKLLITTGFPFNQGVLLGVEGKLVFHPPQTDPNTAEHPGYFTVTASGTEADGEFAHFRVYADTIQVGDTYTSKKQRTFRFPVPASMNPDSFSIVFDNDRVDGKNDRNITVKSIVFGHHILVSNDSAVLFYYKDKDQYGTRRNMAEGTAHAAAQYLERYIGKDSVIAIETIRKTKSKTYTTAVDVRRWLENHAASSHLKINIFSKGPHARRTWTSFRKAFGKTAEIGIFSHAGGNYSQQNWWKSRDGWQMIIRESIGLLYVSIFIW